MKCRKCGAPLSQNNKFCPNCGTSVELLNLNENEIFCSSCGKKLRPKARFCPGCGKRVDEIAQLTTADEIASEQVNEPVKLQTLIEPEEPVQSKNSDQLHISTGPDRSSPRELDEKQSVAGEMKQSKRQKLVIVVALVVCAVIVMIGVLVIGRHSGNEMNPNATEAVSSETTDTISSETGSESVVVGSSGEIMPSSTSISTTDATESPTTTPKEVVKTDDLSKAKKVGSYVTFGTYEQDNDTSNGEEPIEWKVLKVKGNKALLISKYALDCQKYNEENENMTWEECSLRAWLNNGFMKSAFTDSEISMIETVVVTADKNPKHDIDPGSDTRDQIFLLSSNEAEKYFDSGKERNCVPTQYALTQGAWQIVGEQGAKSCWWWLRSPGEGTTRVAGVKGDGSIAYNGVGVSNAYEFVRPALWINLKSSNKKSSNQS